jgi:hypothetical protein
VNAITKSHQIQVSQSSLACWRVVASVGVSGDTLQQDATNVEAALEPHRDGTSSCRISDDRPAKLE